jgi:DNA-binding response OmpR family regulator
VVDYAPDGFSAENLLKRENYDLIVLDLNLPGIDGISPCKRYRHEMYGRTPLVILTAQDDVDVKISALDIGADDYVVKPVSLRELDARIRALIRRAGPESEGTLLTVGDLRSTPAPCASSGPARAFSCPPSDADTGAAHAPFAQCRAAAHHLPRNLERRRRRQTCPAGAHARPAYRRRQAFERQLIHTVRGFGYRMAQDNAPL